MKYIEYRVNGSCRVNRFHGNNIFTWLRSNLYIDMTDNSSTTRYHTWLPWKRSTSISTSQSKVTFENKSIHCLYYNMYGTKQLLGNHHSMATKTFLHFFALYTVNINGTWLLYHCMFFCNHLEHLTSVMGSLHDLHPGISSLQFKDVFS